MKKIIYVMILAFGLWGCNNQTTEENVRKASVNTSQTGSTRKQLQNIYIKDKSHYDQAFIDGLSNYNEAIKIIDNFIVVGKDTTYFPDDLKLKKETIFKGIKDDYKFVLKVVRSNFTNLTYTFQLTDKDNKIIGTKMGKAILGSMFFLASEVDEDDLTGSAFGSSAYFEELNNCRFSIRIGIGLDDDGKQRTMLVYDCDDKSKQTLNLDECPTLRTE